MTDHIHISLEDLTLYAMQALSSEERVSIRQHLAECETCRAELAAVSGDLALMAMSTEQHALPEGARDRFLSRIGAAAPPIKKIVEIDAYPVTPKPQAQRMQNWIPWTAVAALLVVAAGLGTQLYRAHLDLEHETALASAQMDESRRARAVLEVLTAREAQRVVLTAGSPHPVPTARAVYLPSRGALVLQANNLAPIEAGKTYELWIIPANGSAPVPAGLFRPDAAGSASLVLPQIPVGVQAKAFGVTIENAVGASAPTLPIVLVGAVPSPGE